MLGLKCRMPNTRVNMALRDEKLLAVPAGDNVVRLLPPLIVSDDEIRDAVGRIPHGGVEARGRGGSLRPCHEHQAFHRSVRPFPAATCAPS